MTATIVQNSRAAWRLAAAQHDVIARRQLLALGYTDHAIKHRLRVGRMYRLWPGVYAVGRPRVSQYGWWMAAVLLNGAGAMISHLSAAALWGIWRADGFEIDVSVPAHVARRHPGIRVHRRTVLTPADITVNRNIPVTSIVCTLIDIAPGLGRDELEAAVNAADRLGLIDPEALRDELDGHRARTGLPKLRDVLDRRTYAMTDSELERRFLPIARRAGLPRPLTQAYANGYRVDFFWPDLRLVVETDGLTYHRTPAQQARDRVRDQAHAAAGLTPLRFTRAQVRYEPGHVEEILKAVASRALPRGR
jgi:very-short-patch-repair endonuclease